MSSQAPHPTSYIYSNKGFNYPHSEENLNSFSLLPSFQFEGHKVIFTINQRLAIHCNEQFFYSLSEFSKIIGFPNHLDQEQLDKIARIANFLSSGEEFEFIPKSSYENIGALYFMVKKGEVLYQAILSSFRNSNKIKYVLKTEMK